MSRSGKFTQFIKQRQNHIPYFCLYLAGIMIFLFLIFSKEHGFILLLSRLGIMGSCVLFCLSAFVQRRKGNTGFPSRLSVMMVVWFLITQLIQFAGGTVVHHYTQFLPVYLLAFPFAAVTHDEDRQRGLKIFTLIYIAAFLVWVLYTIMLLTDLVPQAMQPRIKWDGSRLVVFHHANNCSRGFLIGIILCLGFSLRVPRRWAKAVLLAAAAAMFVSLSLTNSRSSILIACLLIGGIVFLLVSVGIQKRFVASGILALVVAGLLFGSSQVLFRWNSYRLLENQSVSQDPALQNVFQSNRDASASLGTISLSARNTQDPSILSDRQFEPILVMASERRPRVAPVPSESVSEQNSLLQDLSTFNSRTKLWGYFLQHIRENPSILLWGTDTTELVVHGTKILHSHNSWLEVLLRMGLPGFILSLMITWKTLGVSVVLLMNRQVDIWKKYIALLVLGILFSSFFEPVLFFSTVLWNYIDFLFFLCLGYLIQWKKQICM